VNSDTDCALASLYICLTTVGLVAVLIASLALAGFFAHAYQNPAYTEGNWPFFVWLSYRILLALLVGLIPSIIDRLLLRPPKSA